MPPYHLFIVHKCHNNALHPPALRAVAGCLWRISICLNGLHSAVVLPTECNRSDHFCWGHEAKPRNRDMWSPHSLPVLKTQLNCMLMTPTWKPKQALKETLSLWPAPLHPQSPYTNLVCNQKEQGLHSLNYVTILVSNILWREELLDTDVAHHN